MVYPKQTVAKAQEEKVLISKKYTLAHFLMAAKTVEKR